MREVRVLLHLDEPTRRAIDPLRASRRLRDARQLPEVLALFQPHGFLRIHHSHAVNLARILEVCLQADGREWEVELEPPVNRVLPVARGELPALWRAFGQAGDA